MTQITRQITHQRDGWLRWPWPERLAPVTDLPTAAGKLATVLRITPEPPAHG